MNTFPSGSQSHQLYPHNGRKTEGGWKEIGSARHDLKLGVIWSICRAAAAGPNYIEFFNFARITEGERKGDGRE